MKINVNAAILRKYSVGSFEVKRKMSATGIVIIENLFYYFFLGASWLLEVKAGRWFSRFGLKWKQIILFEMHVPVYICIYILFGNRDDKKR